DELEALEIPVVTDCTVLLGCPIGKTPQHEAQLMRDKLNEQLKVLEVLKDERVSIHHAATILRVSTVHKLDHWLRNVEPSTMRSLADEFDEKVIECFLEKMDLEQQISANKRAGADAALKSLVTAPISLGGDGITKVSHTVDQCWVAGVASAATVPTALDVFSEFDDGASVPNSRLHETITESLTNIRAEFLPSADQQQSQRNNQSQSQSQSRPRASQSNSSRSQDVDAPSSGAPRSPAMYERPPMPRKIVVPRTAEQLFNNLSSERYPGSRAATQLMAVIRHNLMKSAKVKRKEQEARSSNNDRARLLSIRAQGASRLMLLGGKTGNTTVTDTAYQSHFTLRHGISLNGEERERCFGCGHDISRIPNHELGCILAYGNEVRARHNLICDTIVRALNRIGGYARREPKPFDKNQQRPDIEWHIDGRRYYFDVSLTHPLNSTIVAKAARVQLAAASKKEHEKNTKYLKMCKDINSEFIPVVFESYGGYGKQFKLFLTYLRTIAYRNLTFTDGAFIIDDMLNQIAYHIICLNGLIMTLAGSRSDDLNTRFSRNRA
ncbi:hypothetical protein HDU85_001031, partial [Gaertneriomyces sp. JEL0708]